LGLVLIASIACLLAIVTYTYLPNVRIPPSTPRKESKGEKAYDEVGGLNEVKAVLAETRVTSTTP
jgi:hypothetical protein